MTLPQSINVSTPTSSDSPSGAPALFQNIKQFISDVFGITDNTAYQVKAFDVSASTGVVSIPVTGFNVKDLLISKGTISAQVALLDSTVTWNNSGITFTSWRLNVTDTASAAASLLLDLQVGGTSKFSVKKDGTLSPAIGVGSGGTGLTAAPGSGQLLIGNSTGFTLASLTGTNNQITISNSAGSITLSTPQSIHTGASPTFSTLNLGGVSSQLVLNSAAVTGTITWTPTVSNKVLTIPDVTGTVITTGNLTSITTVGTVVAGTWTGSVIGALYGGTGLNTSATSGLPSINAGTWGATTITSGAYVKGTAGSTVVFQATPIPTADLGSGSATSSTFLRGDQTWNAPPASVGGDYVKGLQMKRHATATKITFESADKLVMIDASDTMFVVRNPATFDVDTATAGPAAAGRDQAGAFSNGTTVHVYAIRNGATIAGTVSLTAPSAGGPTLPASYTHWTYLATYVLVAGTTNFPLIRTRGARVFYDTQQLVLNAGGATTETAVSVATIVPSNALSYRIAIESIYGTVNGSGQFVDTLVLRVISGTNIRTIGAQWQGLSASGEQIGVGAGEHEFPNVSQQFFYQHSVTQGSAPQTTMDLQSYTVANGGG